MLHVQLEGAGTLCNVTLTAPRRMKQPVYLYYELQNYYQNHRRYVPTSAHSAVRIVTATTTSAQIKACSLWPCKTNTSKHTLLSAAAQ